MRLLSRIGLLVLILVSAVQHSAHAGTDEVKKKQSQLEKLRKEINSYEKKIKERGKKEHATLELLDTYDRQALLLRTLIANLHDDEKSMENDIEVTRNSIDLLQNQIKFLRDHYAHYISTVYKYGQTYDLELLLSSKSFNQLLIRAEYLKRFSDQRRKDLDKLSAKRDDYEEQNDLLHRQLSEQQELIAEKTKEERSLMQKMKKRKLLLAEIRRDKKNYQREIARKVEAAKEMEQLIAKLFNEERVKKENEERRSTKGKSSGSSHELIAGNAFEAKRGRYRWPVTSGKVTAQFGNQEHPILHTITQNTGIDITVPSGTNVEAIAEGEVSTIWWLPSFGNLVILNHKNGFRSVYAHLSEITVGEGDAINEGQVIAKSGEALSGPLLHFEIWKDREKQDPELWLRPRGLTQK